MPLSPGKSRASASARSASGRSPATMQPLLCALVPATAGSGAGYRYSAIATTSVGNQVVGEGLLVAPVARQIGRLLDDHAGGVDPGGFRIFRIDSRVAYLRLGECDELAAIGRIRENLLVPRDRGVEHHFADCGAVNADGIAVKQAAVRERE